MKAFSFMIACMSFVVACYMCQISGDRDLEFVAPFLGLMAFLVVYFGVLGLLKYIKTKES